MDEKYVLSVFRERIDDGTDVFGERKTKAYGRKARRRRTYILIVRAITRRRNRLQNRRHPVSYSNIARQHICSAVYLCTCRRRCGKCAKGSRVYAYAYTRACSRRGEIKKKKTKFRRRPVKFVRTRGTRATVP